MHMKARSIFSSLLKWHSSSMSHYKEEMIVGLLVWTWPRKGCFWLWIHFFQKLYRIFMQFALLYPFAVLAYPLPSAFCFSRLPPCVSTWLLESSKWISLWKWLIIPHPSAENLFFSPLSLLYDIFIHYASVIHCAFTDFTFSRCFGLVCNVIWNNHFFQYTFIIWTYIYIIRYIYLHIIVEARAAEWTAMDTLLDDPLRTIAPCISPSTSALTLNTSIVPKAKQAVEVPTM